MNKYIKKFSIYIITFLIIVIIILGYLIYKKDKKYITATHNQYNLAMYELINYVENVENYLAKATISSTPENGAETLTSVWREANLAQVYLSNLPINSQELSNTAKFLNQVSDYSYSLSRKNIYNENLTQEELNNLKELYEYSKELKNILEQLSLDMEEGRISWDELSKDKELAFAQQVDNLSATSFSNLDQNFGEYEGLIYDGAYSEHIEKADKKGLVGEEVDEEKAKQIAKEFIGENRIIEINSNGLSDNGDIATFDLSIKIKDGNDNNPMDISISKIGGHIVNMNYNREISIETLSFEDAKQKGKEFLEQREIYNMEPTYYLKEGGIATINYAYNQDGVTIYPDLIKIKVALDNGEILGIETTGYLNNHETRNLSDIKISKEEAKKNLNKNLQITSEKLAVIPTEWKTEILCYEFKGKIDELDFLVYINAENRKRRKHFSNNRYTKSEY